MAGVASIVFHTGGPAFHPVDQQAARVIGWLGDSARCAVYDGVDAFEHLDGCDLLVLMGLHWKGMTEDWAGRLVYRPMTAAHVEALRRYVASGRPLLLHHGAIASHDDCEEFGRLVGVRWVWGETTHSPLGDYRVHLLRSGHPLLRGMDDFDIHDELYFNLRFAEGLATQVHAVAVWERVGQPMILSAEGGRVDGAGRVVYLANGHDLKAFEPPAMRRLWLNAIEWLLADQAKDGRA